MIENTILVVDNERDHLELMKQILGNMGYHVIVAEDAKSAIAMVSSQEIPVVITDLIMPDMEGTELCETIKRIRAATIVLAYSGHIRLFEPDRLERAGFEGFITKPVSIEQVEQVVGDAFAYLGRK
jgi:DNA-binding NtrC family response regulator